MKNIWYISFFLLIINLNKCENDKKLIDKFETTVVDSRKANLRSGNADSSLSLKENPSGSIENEELQDSEDFKRQNISQKLAEQIIDSTNQNPLDSIQEQGDIYNPENPSDFQKPEGGVKLSYPLDNSEAVLNEIVINANEDGSAGEKEEEDKNPIHEREIPNDPEVSPTHRNGSNERQLYTVDRDPEHSNTSHTQGVENTDVSDSESLTVIGSTNSEAESGVSVSLPSSDILSNAGSGNTLEAGDDALIDKFVEALHNILKMVGEKDSTNGDHIDTQPVSLKPEEDLNGERKAEIETHVDSGAHSIPGRTSVQDAVREIEDDTGRVNSSEGIGAEHRDISKIPGEASTSGKLTADGSLGGSDRGEHASGEVTSPTVKTVKVTDSEHDIPQDRELEDKGLNKQVPTAVSPPQEPEAQLPEAQLPQAHSGPKPQNSQDPSGQNEDQNGAVDQTKIQQADKTLESNAKKEDERRDPTTDGSRGDAAEGLRPQPEILEPSTPNTGIQRTQQSIPNQSLSAPDEQRQGIMPDTNVKSNLSKQQVDGEEAASREELGEEEEQDDDSAEEDEEEQEEEDDDSDGDGDEDSAEEDEEEDPQSGGDDKSPGKKGKGKKIKGKKKGNKTKKKKTASKQTLQDPETVQNKLPEQSRSSHDEGALPKEEITQGKQENKKVLEEIKDTIPDEALDEEVEEEIEEDEPFKVPGEPIDKAKQKEVDQSKAKDNKEKPKGLLEIVDNVNNDEVIDEEVEEEEEEDEEEEEEDEEDELEEEDEEINEILEDIEEGENELSDEEGEEDDVEDDDVEDDDDEDEDIEKPETQDESTDIEDAKMEEDEDMQSDEQHLPRGDLAEKESSERTARESEEALQPENTVQDHTEQNPEQQEQKQKEFVPPASDNSAHKMLIKDFKEDNKTKKEAENKVKNMINLIDDSGVADTLKDLAKDMTQIFLNF